RNPSRRAPSSAPWARAWPKDGSGMVAPAPASWVRGSYRPSALKAAPRDTNSTMVWAGVSRVTSTTSCAAAHSSPPTTKAQTKLVRLTATPPRPRARRPGVGHRGDGLALLPGHLVVQGTGRHQQQPPQASLVQVRVEAGAEDDARAGAAAAAGVDVLAPPVVEQQAAVGKA